MEDTGRSSKSGSSSAREAYVPRKDEGMAGASASRGMEEHTPSSYCPVCSERLEAQPVQAGVCCVRLLHVVLGLLLILSGGPNEGQRQTA